MSEMEDVQQPVLPQLTSAVAEAAQAVVRTYIFHFTHSNCPT